MMQANLESEVADLLNDLLSGQQQLLAILTRKRELLAAVDTEGMAALAPEEEQLQASLQQCLRRREALLARAHEEGLPAQSLQALTAAISTPQRAPLNEQIRRAAWQSRLLQQHSLVNWVIVQRTLLHLSQLLEIIATGGRMQPTYGETGRCASSGALLDGVV
jgi:flagellar biosynthesis/type III secretory pathway chaperone